MTPRRKRELDAEYKRAVMNATQEETNRAWFRYLVAFWKEDGDPRIFIALRQQPRSNGSRADYQLMDGTKTPREAIANLTTYCVNLYASLLNEYDLATIDITSPEHLEMIHTLGPEVIKAFRGVDPTDKTVVCTAMAMTWHRFVTLIHAQHGFPLPSALRGAALSESDAEEEVLERDDFETRMTARERAAIKAEIA